ncbi:hypothetical protein FXN63_12965 [Pigmentiphaga aceris]|uniref:Uncharacterized protein n=1 Tax=Pigmentiphaga aceris TaxID=1940612 RepID=A0A5C0AZ07_9BURK|nr:hypothetical protein [Pigmentiphaga aceris]QEI06643.1 hypothetical protein FXN63_12965 [Pigmentiphaga aceris]
MFKFLGNRAVLIGSPADNVAPQPVQRLLPAPRSEENQLRDFHEGLRKLNDAIQRGSKTRAQLNDFQNQDGWDSFWGGLSGRNDKDLAKLLTEFGASLEVTQSVVQLVTQVHTVNNNVLRGFNDALVREIERLQADTKTLDGNQNGALVVLYEFKYQIDEQLALADNYEYCLHAVDQLATEQNNHEAKLQALSLAFSDDTRKQEQLNAESSRQLAHQEKVQQTQKQLVEQVATQLDGEIQTRERLSISMTGSLKKVNDASEALAQRLERAESKMGELLKNQEQTLAQIKQLEAQLLDKPGWLRQQAVALVAVVLSGVALASMFAF